MAIPQAYKDGKFTETNIPATVTEMLMNELWDILAEVEVNATVRRKSKLFNTMVEKYTNLKNRTCGILYNYEAKKLSYMEKPEVAVDIVREYLTKLQDAGLYSIKSDEVAI